MPGIINPWVGYSMMIVGSVLIIVSIPTFKFSKKAFGGLLAVGIVLLVAGILSWHYIALHNQSIKTKAVAATTTTPSTTTEPENIFTPTLQPDSTAPARLAEVPKKRVQWADDGNKLKTIARVQEFDNTASPVDIAAAAPAYAVPDHEPKPVPARPVVVVPTPTIYEPAYITPPVVVEDVQPEPTAGPVYWSPPQRYPTVDAIADERQRFWSKPETPDVDRQRRVGQLREYALTLGRDRDGSSVPIAA